jgi:hypothetical protein
MKMISISCKIFNSENNLNFLYEELKKFVREKTLIKNFFKYKKGVSHYHSGAKVQAGMIDYTFLLPGKNDIYKLPWKDIA